MRSEIPQIWHLLFCLYSFLPLSFCLEALVTSFPSILDHSATSHSFIKPNAIASLQPAPHQPSSRHPCFLGCVSEARIPHIMVISWCFLSTQQTEVLWEGLVSFISFSTWTVYLAHWIFRLHNRRYFQVQTLRSSFLLISLSYLSNILNKVATKQSCFWVRHSVVSE